MIPIGAAKGTAAAGRDLAIREQGIRCIREFAATPTAAGIASAHPNIGTPDSIAAAPIPAVPTTGEDTAAAVSFCSSIDFSLSRSGRFLSGAAFFTLV